MGQTTQNLMNGQYGNAIQTGTQGIGAAIPNQNVGNQLTNYGGVAGNAVQVGMTNQNVAAGVMQGLAGTAAVAGG